MTFCLGWHYSTNDSAVIHCLQQRQRYRRKVRPQAAGEGKVSRLSRGSLACRPATTRRFAGRLYQLPGPRLHAACFHSGDAYRTTEPNSTIVRPPANTPDNRRFQPVAARGTLYALSEIEASSRTDAMTQKAHTSADELKAAANAVVCFRVWSSRTEGWHFDSWPPERCATRESWDRDSDRLVIAPARAFWLLRHYLAITKRRRHIQRQKFNSIIPGNRNSGGAAALCRLSPTSHVRLSCRRRIDACVRGARRG